MGWKTLYFTCFAVLPAMHAAATVQAFDGEGMLLSMPRPELKRGMYSADVIQRWGPSTDKIEYESKRQERWNYGEAHVLFHQARVRSWVSNNAALIQSAEVQRTKPIQHSPRYSTSPQARELLGEILREIPSGQPDPSPSSPVGSVAGAEVRPVQPPGGLVPPDVMVE